MAQNTPIVPVGTKNVLGCATIWGSNTTVSVTPGNCWDSTGTFNMVLPQTVTISSATSGSLGLDTGTIAANSWYFIHVIGSSRNLVPTSALISLSKTAPTLPAGYDGFRYVGQVHTSASSLFLVFNESSAEDVRTYWWEVGVVALSGATASTLTAFSLSNGTTMAVVPSENINFYASVSFTPAAPGDNVKIIPFNSTNTSNVQAFSGVVASQAHITQGKFLSILNAGVPSAKYINSAASCSTALIVTGFEYYL